MNRHTTIKVALRRAHLHSNAKALQHLCGADTDDVQTHNALLRACADDLVRGGALVLEHGIIHGCELRLVYSDVLIAIFLASLRLSIPDGANLRMREHDRGDVGVVEPGLGEFGAAEEAVGEPTAGSDGN